MAETIRSTDVGIIERVYYRVPGSYGYGPDFPGTPEGLREAVAAAKATIQRFGGDGSMAESFGRAWVEERMAIRWLPGSGQIGAGVDRPVDRHEISLSEEEKQQLRETAVLR